MTSAKVAISLPKEVLARARQAVRGGAAASLSAYVSNALTTKLDEDDLMTMFDEMFAESGGPPTEQETLWADKLLGIKQAPKRPKRRRK